MRHGEIRVAVIGKSNQAARHITLLRQHPDVRLEAVFYPKEARDPGLPLTQDFSDVLRCDVVVIASPTPTHAEYLERLSSFAGYVLIEKPAVSDLAQTKMLQEWDKDRKARTRVNFNLLHSELFARLRKVSTDERLGEPMALDVHTSHGLAFSSSYKGSWRSTAGSSLGVLETVGVHFVHMARTLFGPIQCAEADVQWMAATQGPPDTGVFRLLMCRGLRATLRHSYAAPYLNQFRLLGTDGYWEYDGVRARLCAPRDTFDAEGRFATPPVIEEHLIDYARSWRESLGRAVNDFVITVRDGRQFDTSEFDSALEAMAIILKSVSIPAATEPSLTKGVAPSCL